MCFHKTELSGSNAGLMHPSPFVLYIDVCTVSWAWKLFCGLKRVLTAGSVSWCILQHSLICAFLWCRKEQDYVWTGNIIRYITVWSQLRSPPLLLLASNYWSNPQLGWCIPRLDSILGQKAILHLIFLFSFSVVGQAHWLLLFKICDSLATAFFCNGLGISSKAWHQSIHYQHIFIFLYFQFEL